MSEILKFHGRALKKVHIANKNKGWDKYWEYVTDTIANYPFAVLKFNLNKDNSTIVAEQKASSPDSKLGGFATENTISPSICLMEESTKITKKGDEYFVEFLNEEEFAIFMHEVGHFEHLYVDRGEHHAPVFLGEVHEFDDANGCDFSSEIVFKQEYEAGFRSLMNAKKFGMEFSNANLIKKTNIKNLFKFYVFNNEKLNKKVSKLTEKLSKEKYEAKFEKIMDKLSERKWKEFSDLHIDLIKEIK